MKILKKKENYEKTKIKKIKGGSDPSYFIFEINVGKSRIRQTMMLKNELLDRLEIDWRLRHSNSESFYVGTDSFRHWFLK